MIWNVGIVAIFGWTILGKVSLSRLLNQPLDVNGDGNYDAYFYDTDKIADEKYAAIGVYVGTNKSNVLNVKPVQGGYLMEYNYAGRSWPTRQYLYPIPEVVIQFNTNLSQNPGW